MRILITALPGAAHVYPIVPLASALQSAGHEVRLASAHRDALDVAVAGGLTAVRSGHEEEVYADFGLERDDIARRLEALELGRLTEEFARDARDTELWESYRELLSVLTYYSPGPGRTATPAEYGLMVDDLVTFARSWQPDLVLWDPAMLASPIAARACGAAHARYLWGPDYFTWTRNRLAELAAAGRPTVKDPLTSLLEPLAERYGYTVDDEMLLGNWSVDLLPPAMRLPTGTLGVPVRRIPFTGASLLPDWLYEPPTRPRVALTLGVSNRVVFSDGEPLIPSLLEMVSGLDIEVIATLDQSQLAGKRLPENVRAFDFVPLNQLLPTCSAVIHHGGGGTFAAAAAHQVPQLIPFNDSGMEAATTTRYLVERGAGLILDAEGTDVDAMRKQLIRVLEEPEFRAGAGRLHEDYLAIPGPNEVVPTLEKLTMRHRRRDASAA
ncbi:nucleotide disphospho-sugar-binding domain-containing protein [Streptomyces sp. NPDC050848]|uniref:nucleotide disphospho-sugar-binding domain-containing protein n=1 Tax=Streptomyces sp. NPDC050848 TaxID=3155791 RepID=UPI0033DC3509